MTADKRGHNGHDAGEQRRTDPHQLAKLFGIGCDQRSRSRGEPAGEHDAGEEVQAPDRQQQGEERQKAEQIRGRPRDWPPAETNHQTQEQAAGAEDQNVGDWGHPDPVVVGPDRLHRHSMVPKLLAQADAHFEKARDQSEPCCRQQERGGARLNRSVRGVASALRAGIDPCHRPAFMPRAESIHRQAPKSARSGRSLAGYRAMKLHTTLVPSVSPAGTQRGSASVIRWPTDPQDGSRCGRPGARVIVQCKRR